LTNPPARVLGWRSGSPGSILAESEDGTCCDILGNRLLSSVDVGFDSEKAGDGVGLSNWRVEPFTMTKSTGHLVSDTTGRLVVEATESLDHLVSESPSLHSIEEHRLNYCLVEHSKRARGGAVFLEDSN